MQLKRFKMNLKKYQNEKTFTLRMNADLFEQLRKSSEKNKRSIAKEIEYVLEQYFSTPQLSREEILDLFSKFKESEKIR
jgi:hypothetical protein